MNTQNSSVARNVTSVDDLAHGWVHQCDGQGTLDIMQSCSITIFLCSWSVLCLNIPEERESSRLGYLKNKLQWMLFALVFPEVITAIGAEQWASALQCVEDLARLGYRQWTIRHAFFANMGGFMLESPDFPRFPIDGQLLGYLVEKKYIPFPEVAEKTIWDKNKADGFARTVTIIQMGWFCVQCIGRAIQHLQLSTLELTTLTLIFCTLCTFFFWNHKPLDVETYIILRTETTIAEIRIKAGDVASKPYSRTPLDFIKRPRSRTSLLSLFWLGLTNLLQFDMESKSRPIKAIGESKTTPPRGFRFTDVCFGLVFTLAYFGLHLVAWNFTFPTSVESTLWRSASLMLIGLVVFYFMGNGILVIYAGRVGKLLFGKETESIFELYNVAPVWVRYVVNAPVLFLYAIARGYILLEGFIGLKALHLSVYKSVDWSDFIPHI
jgi:hypothetical protein